MARHLTTREVGLIQPIFHDTLRYTTIKCDINTANIGGKENSLTPAGTAYFSRLLYCEDFSSAAAGDQWVFVHEMTHAWQWQHGRYPLNEAITTFISKGGKYQKAYPYDLTSGIEFDDYNLEQQASIVADYWGLLTGKLRPRFNRNAKSNIDEYVNMIERVRTSGYPRSHLDELPL
jgi:hypothetical protein